MRTPEYQARVIRAVYDADQELIGVKLAKICIAKDIPARDVAEYLNVSVAQVYTWFTGKRGMPSKLHPVVESIIQKLR